LSRKDAREDEHHPGTKEIPHSSSPLSEFGEQRERENYAGGARDDSMEASRSKAPRQSSAAGSQQTGDEWSEAAPIDMGTNGSGPV
jgi:hypothetical protein